MRHMWVPCRPIGTITTGIFLNYIGRNFLEETPWMTPGLLKSCLRKENLCVRCESCTLPLVNKAKYAAYRKLFVKLRIVAERQYYEDEFAKYRFSGHEHDMENIKKFISLSQ